MQSPMAKKPNAVSKLVESSFLLRHTSRRASCTCAGTAGEAAMLLGMGGARMRSTCDGAAGDAGAQLDELGPEDHPRKALRSRGEVR